MSVKKRSRVTNAHQIELAVGVVNLVYTQGPEGQGFTGLCVD